MGRPAGGVILLDVTPGADEEFSQAFLERNGHEVLVCHGPEPQALCPLLRGAGCPKFEGAHGIVFDLDLDRPQHRAILERYARLVRADVPIRAVVRPGQAQRAGLPPSVEVWDHEPSAADLDGFAAEVEAADRLHT